MHQRVSPTPVVRPFASLRACLAPLLLCAVAAQIQAQVSYFSARLDGSQEVPPVTSSANGWAVVRLSEPANQANVFVFWNGTQALVAHMHLAVRGQNGPIVIAAAGGPQTFSGAGTLSASQVQALKAGGMYVNVHTSGNLNGEVRGQVESAVRTRYTAAMDGTQTVPPNASPATGQVIAWLHEPDRVLVYEVTVQGVTGTVARIHQGAVGQAGPILFPLTGGGTRWCGVTTPLTDAQLAALQAGQHYVNVHSAAFPGGEIRGQLRADPGDLAAAMDGSQEVPPVTTTAAGHACVTLNPDRTLTFLVTASGLTGLMAHFHAAVAGQNGPVVIALSGGPTVFAGTSQVLTPTQVADVVAGRWYVNVHTTAHINGEVRGQVELADAPTTYGAGCPASNGQVAEIGAKGVPCLGAPATITLQGANAGVVGALLFGIGRDNLIPGVPLPLDLSLIGMTNCFLLHDNIGGSLPATTDSLGCAAASVPVPFVPALEGARLLGQWLLLDQAPGPLNVVVSNALEMRLR